MSNVISISVAKRDLTGSANARRLRREGLIPAVIYSRGQNTETIQVAAADVSKIAEHTGLIVLNGLDGERRAVVKDIEFHTINGGALCIDFQEVKAGEKVTVTIPVEGFGEAAGIKEGGQLEQAIHELQVNGDPAVLPEIIRIDVSNIGLNASLTIADIKLENGMEVVGEPEQVVFHVRIPHASAEATEEAAVEAPAEEKK